MCAPQQESIIAITLAMSLSSALNHEVFGILTKVLMYFSLGQDPISYSSSPFIKLAFPSPKKRSKKSFSFSIILCFLAALPLPPKRDIGGMSLSITVPVVLISPSLNAFSRYFLVSSSFSFSLEMISVSCFSLSCARIDSIRS